MAKDVYSVLKEATKTISAVKRSYDVFKSVRVVRDSKKRIKNGCLWYEKSDDYMHEYGKQRGPSGRPTCREDVQIAIVIFEYRGMGGKW